MKLRAILFAIVAVSALHACAAEPDAEPVSSTEQALTAGKCMVQKNHQGQWVENGICAGATQGCASHLCSNGNSSDCVSGRLAGSVSTGSCQIDGIGCSIVNYDSTSCSF